MKTVLLAGGFGTRISEESAYKPKPLVEIGGMPILWHIMKSYSYYGYNDFIICAGYKQNAIKEWFADYFINNSDITFDYRDNKEQVIIHDCHTDPWRVTVVDTGLHTMTGGRIKRIQKFVGDEPFMMTYGDGVCDVDINKLVEYHKSHGKLATVTTIAVDQRFGVLDISDNGTISSFREKQAVDNQFISAGFMVLDPKVFDYIESDSTVFEKGPMMQLASEGNLMGYRYNGFWQCMDTKREMDKLEELWDSGKAPWKVWA